MRSKRIRSNRIRIRKGANGLGSSSVCRSTPPTVLAAIRLPGGDRRNGCFQGHNSCWGCNYSTHNGARAEDGGGGGGR